MASNYRGPVFHCLHETKCRFKVPRSAKHRTHAAQFSRQHFADEFGWKKCGNGQSKLRQASLPKTRGCAIMGFQELWGRAGAIDFLGRQYGLPPALQPHQTYFWWGPRGLFPGIAMNRSRHSRQSFESHSIHVEYVGKFRDKKKTPTARWRREIPVFLCQCAKKIWFSAQDMAAARRSGVRTASLMR